MLPRLQKEDPPRTWSARSAATTSRPAVGVGPEPAPHGDSPGGEGIAARPHFPDHLAAQGRTGRRRDGRQRRPIRRGWSASRADRRQSADVRGRAGPRHGAQRDQRRARRLPRRIARDQSTDSRAGHRAGCGRVGVWGLAAPAGPGAQVRSAGRARRKDRPGTGHGLAAGRPAGAGFHVDLLGGGKYRSSEHRAGSWSWTSGPPGAAPACRRCRKSSSWSRSSPVRAWSCWRSTCRRKPSRSRPYWQRHKLQPAGSARPRPRGGRQVRHRRDPADGDHRPARAPSPGCLLAAVRGTWNSCGAWCSKACCPAPAAETKLYVVGDKSIRHGTSGY